MIRLVLQEAPRGGRMESSPGKGDKHGGATVAQVLDDEVYTRATAAEQQEQRG